MYAGYGAAGWGWTDLRHGERLEESASAWTLMNSRYVLWIARIDAATLSSLMRK
jgi:hypothetical protein